MDGRRARVLAGVFALLVSMSAMLTLPAPVAAEPVETALAMQPIGTATEWASVAVVGDNVYIIGGCLSVLSDISNTIDLVQIYNVKTMETTYGSSMPKGVAAAAYGVGPDGKIYVAGGWNDTDGSYFGRVQIYDPVLDMWNVSASTNPWPVGRSASAMDPNGNLNVFGCGWAPGETVIYNIYNDTWWAGADIPVPVYDSEAVYYNSTAIYVMGGIAGGATDEVQVYNPVANSWRSAAPLVAPNAYQSAVLGRNGYIYIFGGSPSNNMAYASPYMTIERYDVVGNTSATVTTVTLPSGTMHASAVVDTYGRLLVVAGFDGSSILDTMAGYVVGDVDRDAITIISPGEGAVVSHTVAVQVDLTSFMVTAIDLYVDGTLLETRMSFILPPITFMWNTSGLADGSEHVLLARAMNFDGTVSEDSITVTVSTLSAEERLAALTASLADLQSQISADLATLQSDLATAQASLATLQTHADALQVDLDALSADLDAMDADQTLTDANLTAVRGQVAILQAQLTGLQGALGAMAAGQTGAMTQLNNTLTDLQGQLDDFQKQVDRVENKADSAGTMGLATVGLVALGIAMLGMMFLTSRRNSKAPPPPVS